MGAEIKNFFFLTAKDGMAQAEFDHHWFRGHAALAMRVDPSVHRNIVQNMFLDPSEAGGLGSGLVETWHPDEEALSRLYGEPAFRELLADEPNFVRPGSTQVVGTHEEIVLDRAGKPSFGKLLLVFRADGDGRDQAVSAWRETVRSAALRLPALTGYVESARVESTRDLGSQVDSAVCDAVSELYFPDDARRDQAISSPEYARLVEAATAAFGNEPVAIRVVEVRRR